MENNQQDNNQQEQQLDDALQVLGQVDTAEAISDSEPTAVLDTPTPPPAPAKEFIGADGSKLTAKWYILHTYSGYETMVQDNLKTVFEKNNMSDRLIEVLVPMEEVLEEKNGKRKVVERKKFPCYVITKMVYENNMWHMVTNTRGVTGFVGPMGRPIPLTEEEIKRMQLEKVVVESNLKVGDNVKVLQGALKDFIGVVEAVDAVTSKIKVMVSMFGRNTPVDLEMYQVERVL